jgi:hypothetical protein
MNFAHELGSFEEIFMKINSITKSSFIFFRDFLIMGANFDDYDYDHVTTKVFLVKIGVFHE